jgi:hypothetical protein
VGRFSPQSDHVSALLLAMQQELAETRREMRDNLHAVSVAGLKRDLAKGHVVPPTPQAQASAAVIPATATPTNPAVIDPSTTNMQEALVSLMTAMEQPPVNSAGEELLSHHFTLGTLSARETQRIMLRQYVDITTTSTEKDSAPLLRFGIEVRH